MRLFLKQLLSLMTVYMVINITYMNTTEANTYIYKAFGVPSLNVAMSLVNLSE